MLPWPPHTFNSASLLFSLVLRWTWLIWISAPGDGWNPTDSCDLWYSDCSHTEWVQASVGPVFPRNCGSLVQPMRRMPACHNPSPFSPLPFLTIFLLGSPNYVQKSHFLELRVFVNTILCPCYNWEYKNLPWKGEREPRRRSGINRGEQ